MIGDVEEMQENLEQEDNSQMVKVGRQLVQEAGDGAVLGQAWSEARDGGQSGRITTGPPVTDLRPMTDGGGMTSLEVGLVREEVMASEDREARMTPIIYPSGPQTILPREELLTQRESFVRISRRMELPRTEKMIGLENRKIIAGKMKKLIQKMWKRSQR